MAAGGSFNFTATVTGAGETPTGTVSWTVTDPNGQAVSCAAPTLDDNGIGTCNVTDIIAGAYSATADYRGDPNYDASSGQDTMASISKATSGTTVIDNAAGVVTGGSFSFTATVSGAGATPTGTVSWTVTDPNSHAVTCAPSRLDGSGMGTCTVTDVIAGTYSATADYSGDPNYDASSGQDTMASISKATSGTTVIDNAAGVATGGSFSFTATVSGAGATPTGTVSWTVTDPNSHAVTCAPSRLDGSGMGTCTVTDVIAGTTRPPPITAATPTTTPARARTPWPPFPRLQAAPRSSTTRPAWSPVGASASPPPCRGPALTPTGTVSWTVTDPNSHAVTCAPSRLDGSGMGTCTVTDVIAGTYSATADYSGDANYDASSGHHTTAHIGSAAQTILFTSTASNAVFAGPAYSATAQSTSDLPVTITSSTTGVCSISSGQVSFDGVGTCTLNANQEGDAYWSEAVQVTQTFQVNRATPSGPFVDNIPTNATEFGTFVASVFTNG